MRDGDNLAAHVVVDAVQGVRVDEAVAHPETRLHGLIHLTDDLRVKPGEY